jgi:hypothetical protein
LDLRLRRPLFLAEHDDPEPSDSELRPMSLALQYRQRLPEDVRLVLMEVFVDGRRVPAGSLKIGPGSHVVTEEAVLVVDDRGGPRFVLLKREQEILVPAQLSNPVDGIVAVFVHGDSSSGSDPFEMTVQVTGLSQRREAPARAEEKKENEAPRKFVAPQIGEGYAVHSPDPVLSPSLQRQIRGREHQILIKVCSGKDGEVDAVSFMKRSENPTLDALALEAMARRKYRPYTVGGSPVGFCHPINVVFRL